MDCSDPRHHEVERLEENIGAAAIQLTPDDFARSTAPRRRSPYRGLAIPNTSIAWSVDNAIYDPLHPSVLVVKSMKKEFVVKN